MLFKILTIGAVLAVVYFMFFRKDKVGDDRDGSDSSLREDEVMVECKKCGTFVSSGESMIKNGNYYCSEECMLN